MGSGKGASIMLRHSVAPHTTQPHSLNQGRTQTHLCRNVTAAIAYADAVTAQARQVVNQQDHQAVAKALRAALGNALPVAQERRVARILSEKDQAQYSARSGVLTHALELLQELDGFSTSGRGAFESLMRAQGVCEPVGHAARRMARRPRSVPARCAPVKWIP